MKVFVVSKAGQPLMPTGRLGRVRRLLKNGKAKIVGHEPFTIQLLYETGDFVQPVTLGVDAGYRTIGYSAVSEKEELIGGEVTLMGGMSERLKEKRMYRRQRRNHKRHRPERFDFRTQGKAGWLAPSIQHKLDGHRRLIDKVTSILPVTQVIIEVAHFDIQAIKDPNIDGAGYRQGEQAGFWNLREYILHRDGHTCQNPNCKHKETILQVHHIGYWKRDRSDRPGTLITLCLACHTQENHQPGGFLDRWEPNITSFRPETFLSTVRWRLTENNGALHTYGYITKSARIGQGLEKSHHNDAFVIAGGNGQKRAEATVWEELRRHNRNREKFFDARYIDVRTRKEAKGAELSSGRRCRNKESDKNTENLRAYRARKVKKGQRRIQRRAYPQRSGDIAMYAGEKWLVKGTISNGASVRLERLSDRKIHHPSPKNIELLWRRRGLAMTQKKAKVC